MNRWLFATIAWIGVIFFSSTTAAANACERAFRFFYSTSLSRLNLSDSSYGILHFLASKAVHITLFVVLAALLWHVIPKAPWKITAILLAGLVIGSASELLQRFFPGRDPAIRDVLINLGGTAIGAVLSFRIHGTSTRS